MNDAINVAAPNPPEGPRGRWPAEQAAWTDRDLDRLTAESWLSDPEHAYQGSIHPSFFEKASVHSALIHCAGQPDGLHVRVLRRTNGGALLTEGSVRFGENGPFGAQRTIRALVAEADLALLREETARIEASDDRSRITAWRRAMLRQELLAAWWENTEDEYRDSEADYGIAVAAALMRCADAPADANERRNSY